MALLTADLEAVIDGYEPAGLDANIWAGVADEVRSWVRAAAPSHRRRALQLLYAAAHLAAWCRSQAIAVGASTSLRHSTIERFCLAAERDKRLSSTSRSTIRSRLRCIAAANAVPGNPPPSPPIPRQSVRPPYSPGEVEAYFALARAQSSRTRRQRLLVLLCGALGGGLGTEDFRQLRGEDVAQLPDGTVTIEVRGRRPRRVIVLDCYASELLTLAEESGAELMLGGKADRRSVTTGILSRIEGGLDLPRLDPARLRSTWVVEHLERGVRLDVLMAAAGMQSPTTLADLVKHLPAPTSSVLSQLRGHAGTLRAATAPPGGDRTVPP